MSVTVLTTAIHNRKRHRTHRLAAAKLQRELSAYRTPSERAELAAILARYADTTGPADAS